ncbi:hypothetical protein AJ79_06449 [Helicocarpus griseus UAMH5409]|uniref:Major facilitator superfamily (MFS) profile domain-containing protein n=1 Tax=Helicocarpus griseus UAMH5409 TaxID=1447875 RepID=A0A2B7XDS2_9EURO|nr:hypothetical protein AJ79_06449 [Helicocarpus griseus UAMH5409]
MAPSEISPATEWEKTRIEHADEKIKVDSASSDDLGTVEAATEEVDVESYSKEETTRILRKVDYRLVPLLAVLYLLAFIDRGNLGNAKIAGMNDDLPLRGMQYNIALTVFFVPYAVFEVPSNIVLKILRPSLWISVMLFSWGTVMTLMGIVQNFQGLVAARFFLGFTESGFFPAATFLLTLWYRRYEVQSRMAVFYAAASLSGAFSGLLAFGIEKMHGVGNLAGWRWIFILEGLVPVACSFVIWFILPDSPERATFLTPSERKFLVARLSSDTGSGQGKTTNSDKIKWHHIIAAFKDWKTWAAVVMFWGNTIGVYGYDHNSEQQSMYSALSANQVSSFTATVPTVIRDLGYTAANAQLMTIPIYVVAMLLTLIFAFLSDRYETRTPFIMAGFSIAVLGFIALLAIPHPELPGLTYGMLFLIAMGMYSPFTSVVCLVGNNLAPSSKRAVGMAILISVGNLGGIAGSNIFFEADAPKYVTGFSVCLATCASGIVMAYVLRVTYSRINRERDALIAEKGEEAVRAAYTEEEMLDLGDRSPFYRYTV